MAGQFQIKTVVDGDLRDELQRRAARADRSLAGEVRRALRQYVAGGRGGADGDKRRAREERP
jgi:plasmid stability protein